MIGNKLNNCHQLEWVRGYLESSIKHSYNDMITATSTQEENYYLGAKHAYERLLKSINETFEGGN